MNDRLLSFLGICRRAGKLVIGAEPAAESMRSGKSQLVLYAKDFSQNSLKQVLRAAEETGVSALKTDCGKDELSCALGKLCGVMSVEDAGFACKLREMIEQQGGELYD